MATSHSTRRINGRNLQVIRHPARSANTMRAIVYSGNGRYSERTIRFSTSQFLMNQR
jgi:hypothetical protein